MMRVVVAGGMRDEAVRVSKRVRESVPRCPLGRQLEGVIADKWEESLLGLLDDADRAMRCDGDAPWLREAVELQVHAELLIAVSVLLLASETWIGQGRATPTKTRLALLVGGVGLIHGLGFGGVLLELGSTRGGAVKTLFGFNIGIELGQLALFSVWTVLEISVGRGAERGWAAFRRTVNLTAGILGAFWTIDRTMGWLQELL